MRTETIIRHIYTFDELSEKAKETARQWIRDTNNEADYFWADEALESIKKGLAAFSCDLKNYSIDWMNANRSDFTIRYHENSEELTGLRLRTWLLNNSLNDTFAERKHYGNYFFPEGSKKGRYQRYSRILRVESSCPFTGVCYDDTFLDPIRKFIQAPDNSDLSDLMQSACIAVNRDIESEIDCQNTDEAIDETIRANGYEFHENGKPA